MVKYFLEEEEEEEGIKKIKKIKEVSNKEQALNDKNIDKKCYFHICYHDEEKYKPCKREEI